MVNNVYISSGEHLPCSNAFCGRRLIASFALYGWNHIGTSIFFFLEPQSLVQRTQMIFSKCWNGHKDRNSDDKFSVQKLHFFNLKIIK
jgi:hypothetical protein